MRESAVDCKSANMYTMGDIHVHYVHLHLLKFLFLCTCGQSFDFGLQDKHLHA